MTKTEVYKKAAIHGLIGGLVATGMGIFVATPKQIKWVFIGGVFIAASASFWMHKSEYIHSNE